MSPKMLRGYWLAVLVAFALLFIVACTPAQQFSYLGHVSNAYGGWR